MSKRVLVCLLLLFPVLISGCGTVSQSAASFVDSIPGVTVSPRVEVPSEPNWVSATGYAPISLQPGQTEQQKIIMAMRASKLQAYQELAAIINGQYLFGSTSVQDMVLQNDQFKTSVAGIVRGARVVKSYPVQDDTYATVLEVDLNQVQRAWVHQN
ncbi:LPP20 family lipoprotein [Nitrincola sp. MINF-07-Sa-05]|uniref:LPP20 family lipoprotein n=1 Tax=Nitrincola salilacus TaxID=3400273 RepID=UPI0039184DA6